MTRLAALAVVLSLGPAFAVEPVAISLEDQFGAKRDLTPYRGQVVVLVYGDRKATDACKALGESLHVAFHPAAKGQPPEKARLAPVVALPNLPVGVTSPGVAVIPVACTGKIPGVVKTVLQGQLKKASPDVPVWMDCGDAMVTTFGMTTGEPNLAVIDAAGRARHLVAGKPDQTAINKTAQIIQDLRAEAVRK
jgi:hypothetical protein